MADPLATWGGWERAIRDDPFGHFAEARSRCPVQKARLADGHPAWVVLGYDAARQALNDPRISKDMVAALEEAGDVVAEGLPGPEFSRHMLNVDPPDHTRLRRLVSRAFVPARVKPGRRHTPGRAPAPLPPPRDVTPSAAVTRAGTTWQQAMPPQPVPLSQPQPERQAETRPTVPWPVTRCHDSSRPARCTTTGKHSLPNRRYWPMAGLVTDLR